MFASKHAGLACLFLVGAGVFLTAARAETASAPTEGDCQKIEQGLQKYRRNAGPAGAAVIESLEKSLRECRAQVARSMEPCQAEFVRKVGECTKAAQEKQGECRKRFEPELEACRKGEGCPFFAHHVRENVEWVIQRDFGARRSFDQARGEGKSVFDALLFAQRHNRDAQDTLRQCSVFAQNYANGLLSRGSSPPPTPRETPGEDKPEKAKGSAACLNVGEAYDTGTSFWLVVFPITSTCDNPPVKAQFCVAFRTPEGVQTKSTESIYGRGYGGAVPVEVRPPIKYSRTWLPWEARAVKCLITETCRCE